MDSKLVLSESTSPNGRFWMRQHFECPIIVSHWSNVALKESEIGGVKLQELSSRSKENDTEEVYAKFSNSTSKQTRHNDIKKGKNRVQLVCFLESPLGCVGVSGQVEIASI